MDEIEKSSLKRGIILFLYIFCLFSLIDRPIEIKDQYMQV